MKAFKIRVDGRILDYRRGEELNLSEVNKFFSQKYKILSLKSAPRHIVGVLKKNSQKFFLKLSKSEGIGATTKIEYEWNDSFNKYYKNLEKFKVPKNFECGYFENLFYIIIEYFEGSLLCPLENPSKLSSLKIDDVIGLSEVVQNAKIDKPKHNDFIKAKDYKEFFLNKTKAWLEGVPQDISKKFELEKLLNIVKENFQNLEKRPRHGDFAPWHIMKLNNKLGLIDGEHAAFDGVENYDICYFIQRVFGELKDIEISKKILSELLKRDYDIKKLRTVLAARAIGGYLDESLKPNPDYTYKNIFKDWVLSLSYNSIA